jgi:hypothetical protein
VSTTDESHIDAAAYLAGRLDDAARERAREHLACCPDCADLLPTLHLVVSCLRDRGEELMEPHPDAEALRALARGDRAADASLARHVETCAACSLELAGWKADPGRIVRGKAAGGSRFPTALLAAAAAALAVGLVVGMAAGRFTARREGMTGQRLSGLPPSVSGPIPLILLGGALRGGPVAPALRFDAGQPVTLFGIEPSVSDAVSDGAVLAIHLHDAAGAEIWSNRMTAAQMRQALESSSVVILAVPTSVLHTGSFEFRIVAEGLPGSGPIVIPFRLAG